MPSTMKFTEIDRDMLPLVLDMTPRLHVILLGPPGTGKSTELMNHAIRSGRQADVVTCTSEAGAAALKGMYMPKGGEFVYANGLGTNAFEGPRLLILNEIDNASNDQMDMIHVLGDETGVFETEDGKLHRRHADYRLSATMNGGLYSLRPAIIDRFALRIPVLRPSTPMLDRLDADVRAYCLRVYAAVTEQSPDPEFTYRELFNFCELRRSLPSPDIAALCVAPQKEKAQKLLEGIVMTPTTKGGK